MSAVVAGLGAGAGAATIESQEKLELHPSEVSKHTYRTGAGSALLSVNNSQRDSEPNQEQEQQSN